MPDDATAWQKDNKGRARDQFEDDKPDPQKKREIKNKPAPENPFKPTAPANKNLEFKPPFPVQDNSGRADPSRRPRRHSEEQIEEWADYRRGALAKIHQAMLVEMQSRHELDNGKMLSKYKQPTAENSDRFEKVADRHTNELQQLDDLTSQDEFNLNALITQAHELGQIPDRDYIADRSNETPDLGLAMNEAARDTGRTDEGGGRVL